MLQRLVDAAAVAAEIARVRSLSGGALRRRWQAVFGRPPPEHLTAGRPPLGSFMGYRPQYIRVFEGLPAVATKAAVKFTGHRHVPQAAHD
jgi:hypothetical protein